MKKIYFLLISILSLASCHEENDLLAGDNSLEKDSPKVLVNRQVSQGQAKAFADMMANNIFSQGDGPKVKSATADEMRVIENIVPIVTESSDTVMYSVNFKNDLGYMLIAADKGTFPILAFNDAGSFRLDRIEGNVGLEQWMKAKSELLKERLHEPIDTLDNHYQLWEGFSISDDGEISIELVEYIPESEPLTRARRRDPRNLPAISPSTGMLLKWGQGTGYNADAPHPNVDLAGCPAVAVGMLCYHYWFPNKYNYMAMGSQFKEPTQKSNAVSKMFRDIADQIPEYSWGAQQSGATGPNILIGLKALGYKNAEYKDFNFDEVYRNLSQKHPVLLAGVGSGGHIWYCDGYKEMKWHVVKYKKRLFKKKKVGEWDEYADCLYMNWGWNGNENGYYEDGDWTPGGHNYNSYRRMYTNLNPVE